MTASPRDIAEAAKVRAKLALMNAEEHARHVRKLFGAHGPEYETAQRVVSQASSALLTALDRLIDLDAGVPEERKR